MDIKKILKLVDSDLIRVGEELKKNLQSNVGLIPEVGGTPDPERREASEADASSDGG